MSINKVPHFTDFLPQARVIVAAHRAQYRGEYLMFGGGGGNTTTTQKSDPWSGQQPFISGNPNPNLSGSANPVGVFQSAAQLYDNPSGYPQYYPTSTVAGFNPMETSSLGSLYSTGMNGTPALNSAGNALTAFNNGSFLSVGNPYFKSMADSVASTVTPQIESQFTQGNSMNNPAAAFATAQGLGSALAPIAYQNYSDNLTNMIKSAAISPSQQAAQLQGKTEALGAGQTQQQQDQQQLSDLVNRWSYNQTLPFQMLNQYANTVNGQYGGTSTLTQPYYSNSGSNAMSGMLSGGMAGAGIGTALGLTGMGEAGAAGVGALLPLLAMSDRRLKKNIRRIGAVGSIPLYEFEYLWGGKHIGVMADEVEKVMPQAVGNILGFKAVNYAMIGL